MTSALAACQPAALQSLHRHQLVHLGDDGWAAVLSGQWDTQAQACLEYWARQQLPLVVTRQPASGLAATWLALGLPAPLQWDRRRLAVHVPRTAVTRIAAFPLLSTIIDVLPPAAQHSAQAMQHRLADLETTVRVYGSYGWQAMTGLAHCNAQSDLDVFLVVRDMAHADAVARQAGDFAADGLRLDGELMFADGAAVAWREWRNWRAGRTRAVLVKRLTGAVLEQDTMWCAGPAGNGRLP